MKSVMIFGTFDGVHEGHRELFRQAKCYGDFLIAVVARQERVSFVKKHLPKYSESIRYAMLLLESDIDKVLLGNHKDVYAVIRKWKPDIICLGYDQKFFVDELHQVFSGEIIRLFPFHPEIYKSSKMDPEEDIMIKIKKRLRQFLLEKRRAISPEKRKEDSKKIIQEVRTLPEVLDSQCVALYRSFGSEVITRSLFNWLFQMKKTVVVPCVIAKKRMALFEVFPETKFKKMGRNPPVPTHAYRYSGRADVCIVPCRGFDLRGYRLGSGGGYYDRFLGAFPDMFSVGIAFEEQGIERLPIESHDKKLSAIVTLERSLPVIKRYDTLHSEN